MLLASFDEQRRYLFANRRYAERFGLLPEDLLGRTITDVLGADAVAAIEPYLLRVLAGEVVSFELTLDYPNAPRQTMRSTLTPRRDPSGGVIGWHGAGENVTEERALQSRMREFGIVLHRMHDFVGMADLNFRPFFVNDAGAALVGLEPGRNVAELSVFDFIAPEHHAFLREEFFPKVQREGHATATVQFRHQVSGAPIWMEYGVVRMDDDEGRTTGYATISRNLTETKAVEARLLEAAREKELSLQRFRELADSMPQIVWAVTADGVHDYFNRRWFDLMGVSSASGVDAWDPIHPDDKQRCAVEWAHALAAGTPFESQYRLRFPRDTEYRWYLGRTVPVRDEAGHIVRWYGTSTDIHAQKRAEQELDLSRERLRAALDASETGTFRWEIETGVLDWDDNLKRLFGLLPETPVERLEDFIGCVHPEDRARIVTACERSARDRSDFHEEFRVVRPDGTVRWLLDKGRVYRSGDATTMTGACTDVTERRENEEALRAADRQKDEFLGMLSHELRNPLAPMVFALAQMERSGGHEAAFMRPLAVMSRQVDRLRGLVDDLLDISRVRLGKIDLDLAEVDLRAVVNHSLDVARPLYEPRQQRVELEVPQCPALVRGDERRLGQVVDNLLVNAIKYTGEGGAVQVSVRCEPGTVVLTVRDTGVGIDPARLRKVFDLFAQEEPARAHSEGGLGIGLALVERLVRLHGGSVEANSEGIGRGAEFVVRLPRIG